MKPAISHKILALLLSAGQLTPALAADKAPQAEPIYSNRQNVGFEPNLGGVCQIENIKITPTADDKVNVKFYYDSRIRLQETGERRDNNIPQFTKDDGYSRFDFNGTGMLQPSDKPDQLVMRLKNNSDHIFHWEWSVHVDKETKEPRRVEVISTYVGIKGRTYAPVHEVDCQNIVSTRKFEANHMSKAQAAQALHGGDALNLPDCRALGRYFYDLNENRAENVGAAVRLGLVIGLVFPPAAAFSFAIGGGIGGLSVLTSDRAFISNNEISTQALHQVYSYSKSSAALPSFPMLQQLAEIPFGTTHTPEVSEKIKKVAQILEAGSKSKELCSAINEKGETYYRPRNFQELLAYVKQKIALEPQQAPAPVEERSREHVPDAAAAAEAK